ncbi:hypothetical protein GCM10007874_35050 [Labrys miyagiensis]|uniref:Addiction module component n=1 Tax=Labrys miyagiensis TaxID=346912 RepID=A0ABQ6CJN4_9HYPH|nr:hypothetical protein [Labrys miyagiensis]GLS20488.1 hypothetical protein GCM10007874_35050 [Labrys miyagiensis]
MTKLLEQAIDRVRALPPETQDEFARVLLRLAGDDDGIYRLTPEEEADLIEAEAEIARGELATDDDVQTVFSKYRL